MRKLLNFLKVGSLCLVSLMLVAAAGDDDKAKKLTIADVMQQAHKAPLLKSVAKGTASDEEKQKLLELYVAMAELDAPEKNAISHRGNAIRALKPLLQAQLKRG